MPVFSAFNTQVIPAKHADGSYFVEGIRVRARVYLEGEEKYITRESDETPVPNVLLISLSEQNR